MLKSTGAPVVKLQRTPVPTASLPQTSTNLPASICALCAKRSSGGQAMSTMWVAAKAVLESVTAASTPQVRMCFLFLHSRPWLRRSSIGSQERCTGGGEMPTRPCQVRHAGTRHQARPGAVTARCHKDARRRAEHRQQPKPALREESIDAELHGGDDGTDPCAARQEAASADAPRIERSSALHAQ